MRTISHTITDSMITYQARLIWRVKLWIAPLFAFLIPVSLYLPPDPEETYRFFWTAKINEDFLPLMGIFICANLFSQEWENRTAELWLVRPVSRAKILFSRSLAALAYTTLTLLLPLLWEYFTYVRFNWGEMLLVTLAPTVFLSALGIFAGALTRRSAVAFLAPILYWFFEFSTKGKYTGMFYLFSRTSHHAYLDGGSYQAILSTTFPWVASKWLVAGAGAGWLALSVWVLWGYGRKGIMFGRWDLKRR